MPKPLLPLFAACAAATALCSSTAFAQTNRTLPAGQGWEKVWGGNNGTGTGYATQNGLSQNLFIAPFPVGTFVTGIGHRRTATTSNYVSVSVDYEITLSSTTATLTTLSSTFAANLGPDATVVFPRMIVSVPAKAANTSPTDYFTLPTAMWLYSAGPNFLLQTKSYGSGNVNAWRMDRVFERTTAGDAVTWGTACSAATVSSTSSNSYVPGGNLTVSLAAAAATQPAFAVFGFDLTALGGAVPLPLDLGVVGMTGCTLLVDTSFTMATLTDGTGAASVNVPVPATVPGGYGFGVQWVHADPAASNPLGLLSTVGRLIRIGPIVAISRYVWSLNDQNAMTGSLQAGGPITRVVTIP